MKLKQRGNKEIRQYKELERAYQEIIFGWQDTPAEIKMHKNIGEIEMIMRPLRNGWEDRRGKERSR